MKELVFILTIMNGDTPEGEIVYPNMDNVNGMLKKLTNRKQI